MEYRVRVYAGEKIQDTSLTGRDKLSEIGRASCRERVFRMV